MRTSTILAVLATASTGFAATVPNVEARGTEAADKKVTCTPQWCKDCQSACMWDNGGSLASALCSSECPKAYGCNDYCCPDDKKTC